MILNSNTISEVKGGKVSGEEGHIANNAVCCYIISSNFV